MHLKGSQLQSVCLIVSAIVHLSNGDENWFFWRKAGLVEDPWLRVTVKGEQEWPEIHSLHFLEFIWPSSCHPALTFSPTHRVSQKWLKLNLIYFGLCITSWLKKIVLWWRAELLWVNDANQNGPVSWVNIKLTKISNNRPHLFGCYTTHVTENEH